MPLISVIVPVYKVEEYIHRCVDSILAQTFADFELILVDDGSPDRCGAVCDEYALRDERVYVIHQNNGGLSAARNAGIDWVFANSDSRWISFVDSDDWIHPQMLEHLLKAAIKYNTKVSICAYCEASKSVEWRTSNKAEIKLWPVEQYYLERNVNATVAWGKLYHKEFFKKIRYPAGRIHEDEYVTYRILFAQDQIAVIDEPMYAYFVNPQGITKAEWSVKRLDRIHAFAEQICFFRKNSFSHAHELRLRMYMHEIWSQAEIARERLRGKELQSALRQMHKSLKPILLRYHNLYPFERKNIRLYEIAFPRLMCIYWHGSAIIEKLKKK